MLLWNAVLSIMIWHPAWDIYREYFLSSMLEHNIKKPWFFASWDVLLRTVMKRWARAAGAIPPPLTKESETSESEWETSESEWGTSESDDDWGQVGSALRRVERRGLNNNDDMQIGWYYWYHLSIN